MSEDAIRIAAWEPGEISTEDQAELGGYDIDTVLVAILRDPQGDAGSANLKAALKKASEHGESFYFRNIKSDSILFKGDLSGGRIGIRVPVPRKNRLVFKVEASAAATVRWLFVFAPAWADKAVVDTFLDALQRPTK